MDKEEEGKNEKGEEKKRRGNKGKESKWKKEKRKRRKGSLDISQPQSNWWSYFAKRFSKRLRLHPRSRSTRGAGARAVFRGAGALPNGLVVWSYIWPCLFTFSRKVLRDRFLECGRTIHFFELHTVDDRQLRVCCGAFGGIIPLISLKFHRKREKRDYKQGLYTIYSLYLNGMKVLAIEVSFCPKGLLAYLGRTWLRAVEPRTNQGLTDGWVHRPPRTELRLLSAD
jgi:hypothetical protein